MNDLDGLQARAKNGKSELGSSEAFGLIAVFNRMSTSICISNSVAGALGSNQGLG